MKAQLSIVLLLATSSPAFGQKPKTAATRPHTVSFAPVKAQQKPKASIDKAKAIKLKVDGVVAGVNREKFVGMAVGVITGEDRYQFYYGEAVKDTTTAPAHDTLFAIGSVSKTVTATLLALYNHRGLVRIPSAPHMRVSEGTPAVGMSGPPTLRRTQTRQFSNSH